MAKGKVDDKDADTPAISVEGLTRDFDEVKAVDNVSFQVRRGRAPLPQDGMMTTLSP